MKNVIEVKSINKAYGKKKVLENLKLDIKEGTILGLVGKNGIGKTTLIKCILGLLRLDDGDITIDGHSVKQDYSKAMEDVGFLLEPTFYDYLSVYDNIRLIMIMANKKVDQVKIDAALEFVGLIKVKKNKVGSLSFGMKQRLGLAQAMVVEPKVLILDEPMVGMDPTGIGNFRNKVKEINKENGTTIILSSHQLEEVENICKEVAIINSGGIAFYAPIKEVILHNSHIEFEKTLTKKEIEAIKKINKEALIQDRFIDIKNEKNIDNVFREIAKVVDNNKILNINNEKVGLDQLFARLGEK